MTCGAGYRRPELLVQTSVGMEVFLKLGYDMGLFRPAGPGLRVSQSHIRTMQPSRWDN